MIKINPKNSLLFLLLLSTFFSLHAQSSISGNVTDSEGKVLVGVNIYIKALNIGTQSNDTGDYLIESVDQGVYTVTFSYLSMRTETIEIVISSTPHILDMQLIDDPLEIGSVIVTGTFNQNSRLATSIASSTLSERNIQSSAALGTAELLDNITGTFVDASAGSIFTRVYSRGISSSAEEDIGWYYMSLQEDGLPITNYQTTYYGPDLFHRTDLTTRRVEAVRGGSAMITSTNSPGGIFNFISKTGQDQFGAEMIVTGGLQGENNLLARYDLNFGGSNNEKNISYNIGGFYRYDEGARNTQINWENGGQVKANLTKKYKNGFVRLYGKYLNDKVNRYQGLAATNWTDPQPAFGQDFNSTALNLPKINTNISDGRSASSDPNATYNYNTNNGIKTKDLALGLKISHDIQGWSISNNLKVSNKSSD